MKGKKVRALDQDFVPEDTLYSVLNSFNQMYGYIFRYMVREVGPIAENVLEKYLGGLREARKDVFAGSSCRRTARSTPRSSSATSTSSPRSSAGRMLVDALNELLYAELLAVKRTLGAEHEANIVRAFRDR